MLAEPAHEAGLDFGLIVDGQPGALFHPLAFGTRRKCGSSAIVGRQSAVRDRLRHRLAAWAAHGMTLAIDTREIRSLAGDG